MTLDHTFPMTANAESEIVNLSLSGRKILVMNELNTGPDTLYFYNMDCSFWEKIICPAIPGYTNSVNNFIDNGLGFSAISIFYPSETLFNNDDLLEVAVAYFTVRDTTSRVSSCTIFIINENSVLMDSITNLSTCLLDVFETSIGIFKATVSGLEGIRVYNLPGTIPCSVCGNGLGISQVEKPQNIPTMPIPNPSSNEVKITFTLPQGIHQGELDLYTSMGHHFIRCKPVFATLTLWTLEPIRPTYFEQVVPAIVISFELYKKLLEIFRIAFWHTANLTQPKQISS